MTNFLHLPQLNNTTTNDNFLQLSPIIIKDDYRKKWNIHLDDFLCLTKNGELISDSLYRVGGQSTPDLRKVNYFMLLKHVEAFYPKHITDHTKSDPKHLESRWCIIDKNGIEKVEFKQFDSPYLVSDSCIYSINSNYYNIETGELYCNSHSAMKSADYLFLENSYDKDISKRGIMKINKKDGSWELFK